MTLRSLASLFLPIMLSLALAAACATSKSNLGPTVSATIFRSMNTQLPRDQARHEALAAAEIEARRQIKAQVYERHLSDGRTLEDLAVVDPFVRAVIDDNIRAAQITDRTFSNEGVATVTVRMEWKEIEDMVRDYPQHALR